MLDLTSLQNLQQLLTELYDLGYHDDYDRMQQSLKEQIEVQIEWATRLLRSVGTSKEENLSAIEWNSPQSLLKQFRVLDGLIEQIKKFDQFKEGEFPIQSTVRQLSLMCTRLISNHAKGVGKLVTPPPPSQFQPLPPTPFRSTYGYGSPPSAQNMMFRHQSSGFAQPICTQTAYTSSAVGYLPPPTNSVTDYGSFSLVSGPSSQSNNLSQSVYAQAASTSTADRYLLPMHSQRPAVAYGAPPGSILRSNAAVDRIKPNYRVRDNVYVCIAGKRECGTVCDSIIAIGVHLKGRHKIPYDQHKQE
uniref:Uncharacterized protein n=1 Tax=Ditylenchus dipsaci TaxID=166011 RepID=A0A915E903_9BILA